MTKISRKTLPKEDWEEFFEQISNVLTLFEDKKGVKNFLNDLLTYTEKKMISKRLQVARMLLADYTYDEIETRLHVTNVMITGINQILNSDGRGYRRADELLSDLERRQVKRASDKIERMENPISTKRSTVMGALAKSGMKKLGKKSHKARRRRSVSS